MTEAQQAVTRTGDDDLNWLLDNLVQRVAQVQNAVVLSSDGLRIAASKGLDRAQSDHVAAVAASFQSLARGAGESFGGGAVRQTIVEMETAFLFVTAAGRGACLAVLSDADADLGLIAYEMAMLVTRVGQHLSADPRADAAAPGA
ncbi:roadblock/LC7 domain-containing protein [Actinomadura atramentaria]|uniref:roadblock/LC7 domain-containing protein n=1 Tax=Actinomadura atramentaria TaxID=1990 RepID=UPI000476CCAC|nr:roadblock/LC7 domain-containing protein [Actinomadura atramentaria]